MISNVWSKVVFLSGGCVLALALSVAAAPAPNTPKSAFTAVDNDGWEYTQYVDFASSTIAGHDAYKTFTFREPDVKFHPVQFFNNTTDDYCFEVETSPHPSADRLADTRIWVYHPPSRTYVSLNDDFNNTRFSRGRVYIKGLQALVQTYVAAFSSAENTKHFMLTVQKLNLTEAQCTTGQATVPWVKMIGEVMTVSPGVN
jgi:hypothetical protein